MVGQHVALQTAFLHKRQLADPTFEPPVIIMDPHMLPQRLLPRISLQANITFVHSLTAMLDHMLIQGLLDKKTQSTLRTDMITFHKMHFLYMGRQLGFQNEVFITYIAFVGGSRCVMLCEHMPVSLIIASEGLVALRAASRVPSYAVMRVFLMAHLPNARTEHFITETTLIRPQVVRTFVILQSMHIYKTHIALVAYIIPVMTIHMLQQHFKRLESGIAERTLQYLVVRQFKLQDVVLYVRVKLHIMLLHQMLLQIGDNIEVFIAHCTS